MRPVEVLQAGADLGGAERGQGVAFDLAGAFAGEAHDRADLLKGPGGARVEPEAQDQDLTFAFGEGIEDLLQGVAADRLHRQLIGADGRVVFQEVLQGGPVVADRGVQAR